MVTVFAHVVLQCVESIYSSFFNPRAFDMHGNWRQVLTWVRIVGETLVLSGKQFRRSKRCSGKPSTTNRKAAAVCLVYSVVLTV